LQVHIHGPFPSANTCQRSHGETQADIAPLGWFWGSMRGLIKNDINTTIGEAFGEVSFRSAHFKDVGKSFIQMHRFDAILRIHIHRRLWKDGKHQRDVSRKDGDSGTEKMRGRNMERKASRQKREMDIRSQATKC
jgi:hypothetical protein